MYIEEGFWFLPIHNSNRRVFALTPIICHYFHIVFVLHFQCGLPVYIYIYSIYSTVLLSSQSHYIIIVQDWSHEYSHYQQSSTVTSLTKVPQCAQLSLLNCVLKKTIWRKKRIFDSKCHLRKYIINYMYAPHLYTIRSLNNL